MKILCKPMGPYQTNCYIVSNNGQEIIIDPGMGAVSWVKANVKNPLVILNTHGHSDHIWSNKALQEAFGIPLYCPTGDVFLLENDFENEGYALSKPDVKVNDKKPFSFADLNIQYFHFPGHTPGCSAIKIGKAFFTGDFIFKGSIGRVDFPFSSPKDMKMSIKQFLNIKEDMTIYPGHGATTTVKAEQRIIGQWLKIL